MNSVLKELCLINGTSGDEGRVRDYIISQIKDYCEYKVDALGSIIAFKKGKKSPEKSVCFNAHMDEVGFIITDVTDEGYLRFSTVGGIDSSVCLDRVVAIGDNGVKGVIGDKAAHLLEKDESDKEPKFDKLLIDIGAKDKDEALKYISLGDFAYFVSEYYEFGDGFVKSKALDDRIGCMLMIEMIKSDLEYDTTFCFNVQEEVGLRGSRCTSYAVQSDISVILEATTAADFDGVSGSDRVCLLGGGAVVSFMDRSTIYDKELYNLAMTTAKENGIPVQTKTAIAGGNDAGAIQRSGAGSRVMAVSLPCRYIHSAASVVKLEDIDSTRKLLKALLTKIYD
ncbi:MAG: M42 family peptidase [Eubacterium sp.]|nr:M42 family peptidase [Eubacterium sp.]